MDPRYEVSGTLLRQDSLALSEVFTFVDATLLLAKVTLPEERDKVQQQHIEKLNNEVLRKVAVNKHARIGCKGKKKHWQGYK